MAKKNIGRIIQKLQDKYPTAKFGLATEILKPKSYLATPFPTLNALTKGFPRGHFSTLAGPERVGKGTLIAQTIAYQQQLNKDFIAVYSDAEQGLDLDWLNHLGVDLKRLILQRYSPEAHTMEGLLDRGIDLCRGLEAGAWIIDSIGALIPKGELESGSGKQKSLEDGKMLDLQRKLGEFYRKANVLLPECCATILIGQVYNVPSTTGVGLEAVRGGNSVKHWATTRLMLRRTGKSEAPEEKIRVMMPDGEPRTIMPAFSCRITLDKTRGNSKEGHAINLPFYYGRGFDSNRATLIALMATNIVKKSGMSYSWSVGGEERSVKGKKALFTYFKTNTEELMQLAVQLETTTEEPPCLESPEISD